MAGPRSTRWTSARCSRPVSRQSPRTGGCRSFDARPAAMTPIDALAILVAGIGAGALNAIVGSGSLITFPPLLALGYPPVVANVSNTIGLVPGGVSAAVGYRRELVGQSGRIRRLGGAGGAARAAR